MSDQRFSELESSAYAYSSIQLELPESDATEELIMESQEFGFPISPSLGEFASVLEQETKMRWVWLILFLMLARPGAACGGAGVDDRDPTGYAQVLEEQATPGGTPTVTYTYGLDLISQTRDADTQYYGYDGQGSVRYLTDEAGAITADGTGGDFRFHGAWLEADTGVYHMRARDYDPETGRFLERDPWEGDIQTPETLHPYAFANNNPYFYSDPSGEFTIIEINASEAIQSSLQGFRTYAVQQTKAYAKDKIVDVFSGVARDALETLYPGAGLLRGLFKDGAFAGRGQA